MNSNIVIHEVVNTKLVRLNNDEDEQGWHLTINLKDGKMVEIAMFLPRPDKQED